MLVSIIVRSDGFGTKSFTVAAFLSLVAGFIAVGVGRFFDFAHEDIQKYLFFILIIFLFSYSRIFVSSVPRMLFVLAFVCWLFLAFRISVMRQLGFFGGRIVIGKFDNDNHGLEGRELYQELKRIGLTYNLPGPVVLPISSRKFQGESSARKRIDQSWITGPGAPAIFIFSNESDFEIYFPYVSFFEASSAHPIESTSCQIPENSEFINIKGFQKHFMLPYIPEYMSFPRYPPSVMHHYISWLSAFFHHDIRLDPVSAIDVINEAARIPGPWHSQIPRAFARYLFTLQELAIWYPDLSDHETDLLLARLERAMSGLKSYPHKELEVQVLSLKALCMLFREGDAAAYDKAKSILHTIVDDRSIPMHVKRSALYNLGILMEEL